MKKSAIEKAAAIEAQRHAAAIEAHHNPNGPEPEPPEPPFEIIGVYRGNAEVMDSADTENDARYLVREYALAYGGAWRVYYRKSRP